VRGNVETGGFLWYQDRSSLEEVGKLSFGLELVYRRREFVLGPLAIAVEFRQALSGQLEDTLALWRQYKLGSGLLSDAGTDPPFAAVLAGRHSVSRQCAR